MKAGDYIAILSVIIGILTVIVAIVTIMFGYNLTIFRKRIDNKIEKMNNDFEEKVTDCFRKSIDMYSMQHKINEFRNCEIKSGLASRKNGMLSLISALNLSAEIKNPYLSADVIIKFVKLMVVTKVNDLAGTDDQIQVFDYGRDINESIQKNLWILRDANMQHLLTDEGITPEVVRDCINKIVRAYGNV